MNSTQEVAVPDGTDTPIPEKKKNDPTLICFLKNHNSYNYITSMTIAQPILHP